MPGRGRGRPQQGGQGGCRPDTVFCLSRGKHRRAFEEPGRAAARSAPAARIKPAISRTMKKASNASHPAPEEPGGFLGLLRFSCAHAVASPRERHGGDAQKRRACRRMHGDVHDAAACGLPYPPAGTPQDKQESQRGKADVDGEGHGEELPRAVAQEVRERRSVPSGRAADHRRHQRQQQLQRRRARCDGRLQHTRVSVRSCGPVA